MSMTTLMNTSNIITLSLSSSSSARKFRYKFQLDLFQLFQFHLYFSFSFSQISCLLRFEIKTFQLFKMPVALTLTIVICVRLNIFFFFVYCCWHRSEIRELKRKKSSLSHIHTMKIQLNEKSLQIPNTKKNSILPLPMIIMVVHKSHWAQTHTEIYPRITYSFSQSVFQTFFAIRQIKNRLKDNKCRFTNGKIVCKTHG